MNSNESKVNWGTLENIPEICMDRFGSLDPSNVNWNMSRAFFMTHFDNEIGKDVLNEKFLTFLKDRDNSCRLYMHELTFRYLKYWMTTGPLENADIISSTLDHLQRIGKIVFLQTNCSVRLHFQTPGRPDSSVEVTALSAGSDVGSIMILFETMEGKTMRILYTGDCRLTLKDLKANPSLHNEDGSVKQINKLYLDTSFCLEDAKEFPARSQVSKEILDVISGVNERDSTRHFNILLTERVEHLRFLLTAAQKLPNVLHVPANMSSFLQSIPEFKGRILDEIGETDRIHYDCSNSCDNKYCGNGLQWGVDFYVLNISLGCNFELHESDTSPGNYSLTNDEEEWCKNEFPTYLDNRILRGIYSSNLSRFEMGRMVTYLNVALADVVPLHKSPQMDDLDLLILLEMGCSDGKLEPESIQQEIPSTFYDFTSSKINDKGPRRKQKQFYHGMNKFNKPS